jgi:hypothetical protein
LELEEYAKEGLGEMSIKYEDNRPVLEMFTRKPISLFILLNEESKLSVPSLPSPSILCPSVFGGLAFRPVAVP